MTLLDTLPAATRAAIPAALPAAAETVASLCSIYQRLAACADLRPGSDVDDLFRRLVELVVGTPDACANDVLEDPVVDALAPRLRELCARGETELEREWAARIVAGRRPENELALFPYLDNYRRLSQLEATVLRAAARRPLGSVAFVGSGPLPLSSLFLAQNLEARVDGIDCDASAISAARRLTAALNAGGLRFHHVDAADADLSGYDAVVIAALVGTTSAEKAAMLRTLRPRMDPECILLMRSARGLRTLLYPEAEVESWSGFDVLDVVHPDDDVINSVIVARPRAEVTPVHRDSVAGPGRGGGVTWRLC
ncbi:methyltransferase domain-containing protein [Phytoactinopolyspora alkaliphila]|uniref:Methyltransferase domain-containing protein n=1 Tax=Phytoactinopolyspora alkaliphila TaxID=1783498 RepID=A0A6N9YIU9_9ACTN|nr:nicotianamine synthase family protein [Phytoactinopolyspora alkaliphila]NED94882.1 methyltransferase domain-containing protein [Phytoactinopolyspora alkaliphila]